MQTMMTKRLPWLLLGLAMAGCSSPEQKDPGPQKFPKFELPNNTDLKQMHAFRQRRDPQPHC
jgi:hypothetical protein